MPSRIFDLSPVNSMILTRDGIGSVGGGVEMIAGGGLIAGGDMESSGGRGIESTAIECVESSKFCAFLVGGVAF